MKTIPLSRGQVALVDDEDFKKLNKFKWRAKKNTYGGYSAIRTCRCSFDKKNHTIYMSRQIMSCPQNKDVDHKDHSTLNNQKSNLRICTRSQNMMNGDKRTHNTSGFKGVSWNKNHKKWQAQTGTNWKKIHFGYFDSKIEAAKMYDIKVKELFGEFACTNF